MDKTQHQPEIGKKILDMLFLRMYNDAKTVFREYIQNASDSISEACRLGILRREDADIAITIDSDHRIIEIRDNGTGIPVNEVEPRLLDIAKSTKDGQSQAGQFGIGRLTGGSCCAKLSFKTSAKGEDLASEIIFDIDNIRRIVYDDSIDISAVEVIKQSTKRDLYEEDIDNHYFIVTLEGINNDELLDTESVKKYLAQVAPVDFDMLFRRYYLPSVPEEFKSDIEQIRTFKIDVNGEEIRKPYRTAIEGTGDKILRLEFFRLGDFAWGWYAVTRFSKAIIKEDQNRGLRLRQHNILVSNADFLNDYFRQNRSNNYFYGEIHAGNKVKLTADRDGLFPCPEKNAFKSALKRQFVELEKLYTHANNIKNAIKNDTLSGEIKTFNKQTEKSKAFRTVFEEYTKDLTIDPNPQIIDTTPTPKPKTDTATTDTQTGQIDKPSTDPILPTDKHAQTEPISTTPKTIIPPTTISLTDKIDQLDKYTEEQKELIKLIFNSIKRRSPQTIKEQTEHIINQVITQDL